MKSYGLEGISHMREQIWKTPLYRIKESSRKEVIIDVTTSISSGLPPKSTIFEVIPFLRSLGVESICDFGAGALRHAMPLLDEGFQVYAVEFEETYRRPVSQEKLTRAISYGNFKNLILPKSFRGLSGAFDAALLCYVLQIMPLEEERELVLSLLRKKLKRYGVILYMSRFGQLERMNTEYRCSDGYYLQPKRRYHSFYREFTTEETNKLFNKYGFKRVRGAPLRKRGTDQVFMYSKTELSWHNDLAREI